MITEALAFVPSIASTAGASAATLALADKYLPQSSKQRIKCCAETTWLWLSYQSTWPYLRALRSFGAFSAMFVSTAALFLFLLYPHRPDGGITNMKAVAATFLGVFCFGLFLSYGVFRWVTQGENGLLYLTKSGLVVLSGYSLAITVPLFEKAFGDHLAFYILFIIMSAYIAVLLFGMIVFSVVVLIFFLQAVFLTVMFITGRISAAEKGPVVGASTMLIAFGETLRQVENWGPLKSWAPKIDAWIVNLFR